MRTTPTVPVIHQVHDDVGVITLDRYGKHNALTQQMWSQIPDMLDKLVKGHGVSAVLIRGAHGSFSAGADLSEVLTATRTREAAEAFCRTVVDALLALARCPVPTVSRLSGIASGGGAELALATDLRIADHTARLQLPLAGLGVVPDGFTLHRLLALTGSAMARYLLLTGRPLDADECLRTGLVHHVTADLDTEIDTLLAELGSKSPYALRQMKDQTLRLELALAADELTAPMVDSFVHGAVADNARAFLSARASTRDHRPETPLQEDPS